jgi:hypothetical protein
MISHLDLLDDPPHSENSCVLLNSARIILIPALVAENTTRFQQVLARRIAVNGAKLPELLRKN